jgi:transcriptional regulator with XRE-family HTH domain
MITGLQIRSARSALRWSVFELAKRSGVSVQTIKRFEVTNDIPPSRSSTLNDIQRALEVAGVEFIGTPTDRPGIRVSQETPKQGDLFGGAKPIGS